MIKNFREQLRTQRWDDHRYYHHSRINQSLHFVSAASFLIAYVLLFIDPVAAALIGWLVSMTTRQAGHFFFEPQGLRPRQPGDPRPQGRDQGRLQSAAQGRADDDLGAVAAGAVSRSDAVRHVRALDFAGRFHAPGRQGLARDRHRRPAVPHRPPVLHPRRRDRPGLDDQDPDRPVQRSQAVLQGAAVL